MTQAPILQRLTKRAQFLRVRAGIRSARPNVIVEGRRRDESDPIGVGFTASAKVGGAVVRNRAKRRLREAARQLLPLLGAPGADYVLVARASTADAPWEALLDDLRNALIRLRAQLDRAEGAHSEASAPPPNSSNESD
ncbi:MAG: ribonuclease P protein component [Terricaulis sp.]